MGRRFYTLLKTIVCGMGVLALAACSTDKTNENGGEGPLPGDFAITVTDLTPRGASIGISPKDKTVAYYFDVVSEKSLRENYNGDLEACFKSGLQQYIDRYAATHTPQQVLEAISSKGDDDYTYLWLADDSKYYVLAAGIKTTEIGLTTKLEYAEFQTSPLVQNTFSFSDITPTDMTVKATITSQDDQLRYSAVLVKKADFEASDLSIEAYIDKINQELIAYGTSMGVTKEDAVKAISEVGVSEFSQKKLLPAIDFLLLVAGINSDGYVMSEGVSCEIRTADPRTSEMTFRFEVTDLSPTGAIIKYIPSVKTDRYFFDIVESKDIAGLTDEQIIAQRIEEAGSYIGFYTTYDDYDNDMKTYLDPGTEYVALAFGYISYTTTGLFVSAPFTTPSEQYAQDFGAGTASFFGDRYKNGNDNWQLTFAAADKSYSVALNCLGDGAKGFAAGLPAGEYSFSADGSKGAFSILATGSTVTRKSDSSVAAVTSGKIIVSYEGSNCKVAIDITDNAGHQLKGNFSGQPTQTDYSAYPAIGTIQTAKGTFYGNGNWFINLYDYDLSNGTGYYLAFDLYVSPTEYNTADKGLPIGEFDIVTSGLGVADNGYTKLLYDSNKICDIKSGKLTIAKAGDGYTISFKGSCPLTDIDVSYTGVFPVNNLGPASASAVMRSKSVGELTPTAPAPTPLRLMAAKQAATPQKIEQQPRTRIPDRGACLRQFDL